ncbi:uncharacterized protein DS421_3g101990 [Arachis hypogaea]|nr:uncharacterized protein DS421_3g101990 [Arachis hypogaea]
MHGRDAVTTVAAEETAAYSRRRRSLRTPPSHSKTLTCPFVRFRRSCMVVTERAWLPSPAFAPIQDLWS